MRRPHLSTGAWIFASVALLVVAVPTGVYAASTATNQRVQDGSGSTLAAVDAANQLLTAEASPANLVAAFGYVSVGTCSTLYTIPTNKALIVKSVNFYLNSAGGSGNVEADLYATTSCNAILAAGIAPGSSSTSVNQTLGAGVAVPAGGTLAIEGRNIIGSVQVYGYLVPKSSVPASALANLPRSHGIARPTSR